MPGERLDQVGVGAGDELVHQLHDGDARAQLGVDGGHLEPDDPAAEHEQPPGDVLDLERGGRVEHPRVVVRDEGQAHRLGAGRDDRLVEPDDAGPSVRARDLDAVRRDEAAGPLQRRDLALLGQPGQAPDELADDAVLPRPQPVQVDGRGPEGQAVLAHLLGLGDHLRGVQQRLRRDAADVEADPAQGVAAVDDHDLEPEVGRAERRGVAAGAGAEHEQADVAVLAAVRGGRRGVGGDVRGRGRGRRGGGLLRRRRGGGLVDPGVGGVEDEDRGPPRDAVPDADPHLAHRARDLGGHVHRRLVGLQRQQRLVEGDLAADRDVDLDDGDVGEVPDVGDLDHDLAGHAVSLRCRSGGALRAREQ